MLLVEDDKMLGAGVQTSLKKEGYAVDWVEDGDSALKFIGTSDYDLLILDLGLPDMDGIQVLSKVRSIGHVIPVLILTARDSIDDRVRGLDVGADDYMVKPFDLDELLARIRALSRRKTGRAEPEVSHGDVTLYPDAMKVEWKGEQVELTRREFMLLQELLANAGRVLTREQLERSMYDWTDDVGSNAIEVSVHRLRKKFYPGLIKTVRGIGYVVENIK